MAITSGKDGRFLVGSTPYKIERWSVDPETDKHDYSNSETGIGYIHGLTDYIVEISLPYDQVSALLTTLGAGATLSTVHFRTRFASDPWTFDTVKIFGSPMTSEVRGKQMITLRGHGKTLIESPG